MLALIFAYKKLLLVSCSFTSFTKIRKKQGKTFTDKTSKFFSRINGQENSYQRKNLTKLYKPKIESLFHLAKTAQSCTIPAYYEKNVTLSQDYAIIDIEEEI